MTDRQSIRSTLLQFLREDTAVDLPDLPDATVLREGLELDSVDFVGLVMRVEGEYRIRLDHKELEGIVTAGDLFDLIEAKIAEGVRLAA